MNVEKSESRGQDFRYAAGRMAESPTSLKTHTSSARK